MSKVLLWGPALWFKGAYSKNMLGLGIRLIEAGHEVSQFAFGGLKWGIVPYPTVFCPKCGRTEPGEWEDSDCPKCQGPRKRYVIKVYPNGAEDYGQTWLPRWFKFIGTDAIIFHYDSWPLGTSFKDSDLPILWYPPVDHSPVPPPVKESLEGRGKVIAMTKFTQKEFKNADIKSVYIPHAIEPKVYYPRDKKEARRRLSFPEDAFIITSVGTNKGPRKNLGNLLRAYKMFLTKEPRAQKDAFLYLHCNVSRGVDNPMGYELPQIWQGLHIAERIKYVHPVYYEAYGFTEDEMADVYSSSDWSILCSLGEGWGLPLAESLACGTPVIYGNYSAMPEIVGPGGLSVRAVDRMPFELSSSFQWVPSTKEIAARMAEAYRDWKEGGKLRDELGSKGRAHVLALYTWEKTMPLWLDLVKGETKPEAVELKARGERVPGEVDIILITYNRLDLLKQCVEALYSHTTIPFHLVIVDDQSMDEDKTRAWSKKLWEEEKNVTYVRRNVKAVGGSEIMNVGFKYCRNDLIVSMNNDIVVTDSWLEEAVKCMDNPRVGIVGMKFLWPWDNKIQHAGGTFVKGEIPVHIGGGETRKEHSETAERLWVSGPCVLIRRQVLEPGWSEDYDSFGGHEDVDLCLRARSQGWKVLYCGTSVVYHYEGATVTKLPGFDEMFNRNRMMFSSKWRGNPLLKDESLKTS